MKKVNVKNEQMRKVFESAAKFQQLVPGAVMVGGSAVSAYIGHRDSFDHDHVLKDLAERFSAVFELLSEQERWQTAHVSEGKIILGSFDGVETGLRQLRRVKPIEVETLALDNNNSIVVPTQEEILRIKAFLITNRNQVRDFLDVAALATIYGLDWSIKPLLQMDFYYEKILPSGGSVLATLIRMLANPAPRDSSTTRRLSSYKGLDSQFHNWATIVERCKQIAARLIMEGSAKCSSVT